MKLDLFILVVLLCCGAEAVKPTGSKDGGKKNTKNTDETAVRFMENVAVNKRDPVNQGMYRLNDELYGNKMLEKRGNELNDLLNNPPLGSHDSYCFGQRLNSRCIFSFCGVLAPQISYVYLSSLGRLLRLANPSNEPLYFHHYFDLVSLHTGCEGTFGDKLVGAVLVELRQEMFINRRFEKKHEVKKEVESMRDNLEVLMTNNTALLKPTCKENSFVEYFEEKMMELEKLVDNIEILTTTDMDMHKMLFQYLHVSPYASCYYICIGFTGEHKKEAANVNNVLYKMRQGYNNLMEKEMKREALLMNSLKPKDQLLDKKAFYRHKSYVIPAYSTLHCGNLSGEVKEEKVINLYYCGDLCEDTFKEEERNMEKEGGCDVIGESKMPCTACYVVLPDGTSPKKSNYAHVGIYRMIDNRHVVIFPERNMSLPNLVMEELKVEDVVNLTEVDMIWRRPTPPKTHFPTYPKRANYIPHNTRGELDWEWLKWTSIKLYFGITAAIWITYFTLGNYFYIRRWIRRRLGRV